MKEALTELKREWAELKNLPADLAESFNRLDVALLKTDDLTGQVVEGLAGVVEEGDAMGYTLGVAGKNNVTFAEAVRTMDAALAQTRATTQEATLGVEDWIVALAVANDDLELLTATAGGFRAALAFATDDVRVFTGVFKGSAKDMADAALATAILTDSIS